MMTIEHRSRKIKKTSSLPLRHTGRFLFCIALAASLVPGLAHATIYQPGATLEPDCAPGSANCGVAVYPLALGTSTPIGTSILTIAASSTNSVLATLRAFAGQVANLLQIQNSAGTSLLTIDSAGIATFADDINVNGSGNFNSDLVANGANTGFTVTNDAEINGALSVAGVATIPKLLAASTTITGNFSTPKGANYSSTGVQNNINFGVGSLFQFVGSADLTITGIAGGGDGRFIRITNNSSANVIIASESASSTAANRITVPGGDNITIAPNVSIGFQYNITSLRWNITVLPAVPGTISGFTFLNNGNSFGSAAVLGTSDNNLLRFITASSTRFTIASSAATFTGTGATTFTTDNSLTLSSAAASALSITAGTSGTLTLNSGTVGDINIGTTGGAKVITIGNTTGATALNFNSGTAGITLVGSTSLQNFTATNGTTTNFIISSSSQLGTVTSGTWNGSVISAIYGGTGQTSFTAGDILYASNTTTLTKLNAGSVGTVLKISGLGLPSWGTDLTSGGGEGLLFATSSNNLFIYPTDPTKIIVIGSSATSSSGGNIFEVTGNSLFTGNIVASNATTANMTVSGSLYAANITGGAQNVTLARIGSSTFSTLQDLQNVFHSAGWVSGGGVTDIGGGAVSVAAGTGLIRSANSATSTVSYTDWIASTSIAIATNSIRYIGVEYNSGSPRITVRTSSNWNYKTDFPLSTVANENGTIHIGDDVQGVGDHAANMIRREYETMPLERDERNGGLMLTESADNNRKVMLSAGALWDRLTRYPIAAIDTASGGTFDTYVGTVQQASAQTQWDNTSYNNGGTLTTLSAGKYAVLWFYVQTDGGFVQVYGTNQYSTLAAAVAEEEPTTLPLRVTANGKLVGRIIFQKSATIAADVNTPFNMNQFNSTALTFLANLQGLDYNSSGLTGFVASGGISGGQTIIGGTSTSDGLTLKSTTATGTSDFIKFLVGANGATEAGRFTSAGNFSAPGLSTLGYLSVTGTSTLQDFIGANATTTSLTVTGASRLTGGFTASATSTVNGDLHISGPLSGSSTLQIAGAANFYSTGQFDGALTAAGAGTGLAVTNNATIGGTLGVTGLLTPGSLTVTATSTLQNFTATNATTTNLVVSSSSRLGTITSGIWNSTAVGPTYGGTDQTSWTKGDILYASAANTLSKLPIGATGTVLTVSVSGLPSWAASGGGGSGSDHWATTTDSLAVYPSDPGQVVLVGASAITGTGNILEVTGNSVFTGAATTTGALTVGGNIALNGGALTTTSSTANLFNTNATTLNIGGAATTIRLGAAGATLTGAGALTINSGATTTLALDSGTTGAINIGTTSTAKTITIGNGTGATSLVFNAGTGNIDIGTGAFARAINLGTGAAAQAVTIGSTNTTSSLTFNSGTGAQTFNSSVTTGTSSASAFVFNASALTSGTALRLTSAGTSGILFDQNLTNTSGTIDKLAYGSSATLAGTTVGLNMDLNTNVTATGITLTGMTLNTAADSNIANASKKGITITTGALTQNTASATGTYVGADITMSALTLTSGSALNAHGLRVTTGNITQSSGALTENGLLVDQSGSSITTGGTINALNITATGVGAGTLNGLKIGNITAATGTETALNIGSGWDTDLSFVSTAPKIAIGNTGTLSVTDGTNVLASIIDQGTYGTFRISDKGSTGDPATCTTGEIYFNGTDRVFKGCTATNTWTSMSQNDNVKITSSSASVSITTSEQDLSTNVSITPKSSTSEILLNGYAAYIGNSTTNTNVTIRIRRGTSTSTPVVATTTCGTTDSHNSVCSWTAVDSPATTSMQTYSIWARGSAANGTVTNRASMAMEVNVGADIAELYGTNDASISMGDVVSVDTTLDSGVAKSAAPYDSRAIGVVSTRPAVLMGSDKREGINSVPVALAGRVPVKVSTVNGVIKAGDYLTTSDIAGVAMKATEAGPVIGQAISDYQSDSDTGVVIMFIKNTYYDGRSTNSSSSASGYSIGLLPVLLGDISLASTTASSTQADNGLSTLLATIQKETPRDPVEILTAKISAGSQFFTDFIAARVTAIRGYFDELFAKKIHTEVLCVKKSDGSELCVGGDEVDKIIKGAGITPIPVPSTPQSDPTAPSDQPPAPANDPPSPTQPVDDPTPANPADQPTEQTPPADTPAPQPESAPAPQPETPPAPVETP